jgi:hypothetical protein
MTGVFLWVIPAFNSPLIYDPACGERGAAKRRGVFIERNLLPGLTFNNFDFASTAKQSQKLTVFNQL